MKNGNVLLSSLFFFFIDGLTDFETSCSYSSSCFFYIFLGIQHHIAIQQILIQQKVALNVHQQH